MDEEERVKFMKFPDDDMTTVRIYADEFWGDLAKLLEEKYGFDIDDIVFSDTRTHCGYCGGKLSAKQRILFSRFTNDFTNFCFSVGRRRLEVERRNSEPDEGLFMEVAEAGHYPEKTKEVED